MSVEARLKKLEVINPLATVPDDALLAAIHARDCNAVTYTEA